MTSNVDGDPEGSTAHDVSGLLAETILHWDYDNRGSIRTELDIRPRRLGDVRVARMSGSACRAVRSEEHRQRDGGDFVGISCLLQGLEHVRHDGREHVVRPMDVLVWENSGDLGFSVPERSCKLMLLMPKTRFDSYLLGGLSRPRTFLSGHTPMGAMVAGFLSTMSQQIAHMDDTGAEAAVDMALNVISQAIKVQDEDRVPAIRTTLFRRITVFIDRHLEDPELSPGCIAQAHGISIRYLHLLFANRNATVSGWIREQRLQRCREELEHARRGLSLTEIAYNWGFSDAPHFSRTFKKRYGVSPKAWRSQYASNPALVLG